VVTTAIIDAQGHLSGAERLIGFKVPADAPADAKEKLNFIINNPNTFSLERRRD
jgi:hypothetical protein